MMRGIAGLANRRCRAVLLCFESPEMQRHRWPGSFRADVFDLFAMTHHVECVAILEPAAKSV
jgi:hypothetical protein